MTSAYLICRVKVRDPGAYANYTALTPALIERHGGRFLVRGGDVETLEGETFADRLVVIEFPSPEAIRAFYASPDYQHAKAIRVAASEGELLLVEGYSPS